VTHKSGGYVELAVDDLLSSKRSTVMPVPPIPLQACTIINTLSKSLQTKFVAFGIHEEVDNLR
jgi:hypothetical protein